MRQQQCPQILQDRNSDPEASIKALPDYGRIGGESDEDFTSISFVFGQGDNILFEVIENFVTDNYAATMKDVAFKSYCLSEISPPSLVPCDVDFTFMANDRQLTASIKTEKMSDFSKRVITIKFDPKGASVKEAHTWLVTTARKNVKDLKVSIPPTESVYIYDFNSRNCGWIMSGEKPPRDWNTVSLAGNTREKIRRDIDGFMRLAPHISHIAGAYRRILMFHGPPGSGKSSIAMAIATEMKSCIYRIRSSGMTGAMLAQSIQNLSEVLHDVGMPIILLEDVDELFRDGDAGTAGVAGASHATHATPYGDVYDAAPQMGAHCSLSFSDLLGVFDGPDSPNKALFILSSNRPTSYDPAFLRRIHQHWEIKGVDAASVSEYLTGILKLEAPPTATEAAHIAAYMTEKDYQIAILRECVIRAYYARDIAAEDFKPPTPADVYDQLREFKPLSKTVLVTAETPTLYG